MAKQNKKSTKAKSKQSQLSNNSMIAGLMIVGILAISVSFVLSRWLIGEIRFNNQVLSEKRQASAILETNVANLDSLRSNFEQLEDNGPAASTVLRALPTEHAYHDLAGQLETLAGIHGVQLLSLNLGGASADTTGDSDASGLQTVTFQLTANGSYADIQSFLRSTALFLRPIQIGNLKLNGTEPTIVLEASLTTYFQPRTDAQHDTKVVQ